MSSNRLVVMVVLGYLAFYCGKSLSVIAYLVLQGLTKGWEEVFLMMLLLTLLLLGLFGWSSAVY